MMRTVLRGVEGVDKVKDSMLVDEDEEWGREEEEEFGDEDMMSIGKDVGKRRVRSEMTKGTVIQFPKKKASTGRKGNSLRLLGAGKNQ